MYALCSIILFIIIFTHTMCIYLQEPPPKCDHTLPPKPRVDLHIGEGATLADFDKLLRPFAAKRRQQQQQTGKEKEKDGK